MNRLQLIELEDLAFFPTNIRRWIQEHLDFLSCLIPRLSYFPAKIITELKSNIPESSIIDYCSGAGGPAVRIANVLSKDFLKCRPIIWLSDLYPNVDAFERAEKKTHGLVKGYPRSISAAGHQPNSQTIRLFCNAFHHLHVNEVKQVLKNAKNNQDIVVIVEHVGNHIQGFMTVLIATLLTFASPLVLPWQIGRILFTYLVPVIPFVVLYDGLMSCFRVYSTKQLQSILPDDSKLRHHSDAITIFKTSVWTIEPHESQRQSKIPDKGSLE